MKDVIRGFVWATAAAPFAVTAQELYGWGAWLLVLSAAVATSLLMVWWAQS